MADSQQPEHHHSHSDRSVAQLAWAIEASVTFFTAFANDGHDIIRNS